MEGFYEKEPIEESTEILRPLKYMRPPPGLLKRRPDKSLRISPESITCYLKKLIRKQCKMDNKVANILNESLLASSDTLNKLPIKASRLSPFVHRHIKLTPLPSQTPHPTRVKKHIRIKEKTESHGNKIGVLSVSTKRLNKRSEIIKKSNKIEVGIGTREDSFLEYYQDYEEDDIDEYCLHKGCLS